jgi:hypothetical protein
MAQLLPVHEHMEVHSAAMEICEHVMVQTPVLTSYMQLLLATHSDLEPKELQPPVHAPLFHMHCVFELQLPALPYWLQPLSQLPEALFHAQAGSRLHPLGLLAKAYGQVKEQVPKDHWHAETAWQPPWVRIVLQIALHVSLDGSQKHDGSAWQAVVDVYALPQVRRQTFCLASKTHIGCWAHSLAFSRGQLLVHRRAVLSHMQELSALHEDSDVWRKAHFWRHAEVDALHSQVVSALQAALDSTNKHFLPQMLETLSHLHMVCDSQLTTSVYVVHVCLHCVAAASNMQLGSLLQRPGSCVAEASGNRTWHSMVQLPLGVTMHMSLLAAQDVWSRLAHAAWHCPAFVSNMQLAVCAQHALVTHVVSHRGEQEDPDHAHEVSVPHVPDVPKLHALMHCPAWRFHVQFASAAQVLGVT